MFRSPEEIAVEALIAENHAVQAASWVGLPAVQDEAGLYTWWVDSSGAEALAQGSGHHINRGLLYGGQAGATRWPSGKRSDQTLNGRIGSNHLGGSIRGSTFRRTLAALLVEHLRLQIVPGRKVGLSPQSEAELSQWMQAHLAVVVWPFSDRDALGAIEEKVLEELNPPLNLRGMVKTPLRAALSKARKGLSSAPEPSSQGSNRAQRLPTGKPSASSVTLHEEIADILIANENRSMTCDEIAEQVNDRGRYQKRDKSAVTAFQIHGRTRNYSKIFQRDGQKVRLLKPWPVHQREARKHSIGPGVSDWI